MEENVQIQINEINRKLDLVLEHVNQQRLKTEAVEDLVADVSIIGKEVYNSTVHELELQNVEFDMDEVKILLIKLVKNVGNFRKGMEMLESVSDLMKDLGPIANEVIIDFTKKMHEFDQKGYFEFFGEAFNIMDNIVTHYSREDVRALADNVITILDTIKNLTQPEMLGALNNGVQVFSKIETENIPEYSLWKAMKELRSPEMQKGLGFIITFMKNLAKTDK